MVYCKEDLETDLDWLRGLGCDTEEIKDFVVGLIKKGFIMSKQELINFLDEVNKI